MRRLGTVVVLMLLLIPVVLVTRSGAQDSGPITDQNVAERVASAKTAADHQALATFFQAQAAAAGEKVKEHEAMAATSKQLGGKPAQSWAQHCSSLIRSYKTAQKDYEALALEQEKLAKGAK
jgi:hypothetical protein